jgi:hypothetical protein
MKTFSGPLPSFSSLSFLVLFALAPLANAATNALVDTGAVWRFLDDGSDEELYWVDPLYDDSFWNSGASPLGFGENYIVTETIPGIITTYFRHTFNLADAQAIANLTGYVLRDDGVRIFLNGVEIFRNNLPPNITYTTLAASGEALGYLEMTIDPGLLQDGPNVLAAEVHQVTTFSSDLVFDFKLFTDSEVPKEGRIIITQPGNGDRFRGGANIAVSAVLVDVTNTISSVQFFAESSLLGQGDASPYSITWSNTPLGDFLLRAIATMSDGTTLTSQPVAITIVATNASPRGSITNPENGAMLGAGDIRIEATGSDDVGVVLTEFFANGSKLGEDASQPFSITWSNASPGSYSLTARFTDNEAATADSAPVSVEVVTGLGIVRGPYLQTATKHSIIVRWRTDVPYDSEVRYGTTPGQLNTVVNVPGFVTEHEVPLTGLSPKTKYYYSVGHSAGVLAAGPDYYFITHPPAPQPTRIWVIGDSGTGSAQARAVFDQYRALAGTRYTDLWLMLGDNAYFSGTDYEYQVGMFDMYPELLRQTAVWPALGNHEGSPAYYDIFTLPRNGEAGGVPSGTEHYFSFDYGNIHFVNLDGYWSGNGSRLSNSVMWSWLEQDLAAHTNEWLIAYWHQPPYTKGSHDSDREIDLIQMRENFVPMLEAYGVDLVLCGHSHVYERSYFLHGHYGHSSTLQPEMILDGGSGRIEESGPYLKVANQGTVYVVAGSSGWATFGSLDHPAMHTSLLRMGSLVLDIDGGTLNARFLRETGEIDDYFAIQKGSIGPTITGIELDEGTITIRWTSIAGVNYQLQYATDLTTKNWESVGPRITAEGPETATGHIPPPSRSVGFYRVIAID